MYQLLPDSPLMGAAQCVRRIADNCYIPFNESNTDYQAYLKWLDGYEPKDFGWIKTSEGNTPLPAEL